MVFSASMALAIFYITNQIYLHLFSFSSIGRWGVYRCYYLFNDITFCYRLVQKNFLKERSKTEVNLCPKEMLLCWLIFIIGIRLPLFVFVKAPLNGQKICLMQYL